MSNTHGTCEFLAFSKDAESLAILRQFAAARGWPEVCVVEGDAESAAAELANHPSPAVLLVDIPSAEAAPALLDKLADVCEPGVKVIVSGKVNEYSFYCWLVEIGITSYLLKPFTLQALEAAYLKVTQPQAAAKGTAAEKKEGKLIPVLGTRGGVGATTLAVNLAWALASHRKQKTALLDLDPHAGTVALALDLEPGRGLRDALEKPDRIDALFMERVMMRYNEHLSVLSAEEPFEEPVHVSEQAADALIRETKSRFAFVIADLPRQMHAFSRELLKRADQVIVVTETTMPGLRDALRLHDYFRDVLKIRPPLFIANREGVAGKHHMPRAEFEKGLGAPLAHSIPFVQDAYASANSGEILIDNAKQPGLAREYHTLASRFAPAPAGDKTKPPRGLLDRLKGK
jgi:pilus assembly protein CpaE